VIPHELAEYAESPAVYSVWPPGFRRVLNDRYCLMLGPSPYFTEVQRPRFGEAVEETVAEIRALVRETGHRTPMWWLGASSTPDDLAEQLLELGFAEPQDRVNHLVALAIQEPPEAGRAEIEVRRVETLEDFARASEVMWEAFDTAPERRQAQLERLDESFRSEREHGATATFLALLDGRPVAMGRAAFCERGGLLFGGSTLPDARGRGAYRALVRARWDEAVRRGVPALVTQAAPSSEPILRRLGFEEVCRLRRLEDPT
jgi:GNAT superfamily N-acetyltransferase